MTHAAHPSPAPESSAPEPSAAGDARVRAFHRLDCEKPSTFYADRLTDVTDMTGGRVFSVERLEDLPDIATKIGMELRNQYVLGYHPSNKAHDARWRKIKVKLRAPKGLPPLSVYNKTGYYAPSH